MSRRKTSSESCCRKEAAELLRIANRLSQMERQGDKWKDKPKGWTDESRKKFWDSLTGDVKHKVTKCIEKMKGKVDDPGAFCASLKDRIEGTTEWRGED